MNIVIFLDRSSPFIEPGGLLTGGVGLHSDTEVFLRGVEVRASSLSASTGKGSLTGTLMREGVIQGSRDFPLALRIPSSVGTGDGERWMIEVVARGEEEEWSGAVEITVRPSAREKIYQGVTTLLFGLPFLAVGIVGIGFGMAGAPGRVVPEGVLWFAFCGGVGAMLIARSILAGRGPGKPSPVLAFPVAVIITAIATLALVIALLQPDLHPFAPVIGMGDLPDWKGMANGTHVRSRIMGLLAAGILLPTAAGIVARRSAPPALLAEIALTTTLTTIGVIVAGYLFAGYQATGALPAVDGVPLLLGLVGVIVVLSSLRRSVWTSAPPIVTIAAGLVPLAAGTLVLRTDLLPGVALLAWGCLVLYRGGRNVLARRLAGDVKIRVLPSEVSTGESVTVEVRIRTHPGVRATALEGVLRCDRTYVHWNGTDRHTDTVVVHNDRRRLSISAATSSDDHTFHRLGFVIPVGSEPSDGSSSSTVVWTLVVTVRFAARPDWREEFTLRVLP